MAPGRTKKEVINNMFNNIFNDKEDFLNDVKRRELHFTLYKTIDYIFELYRADNSKAAEEAIDEGVEIFQQLYPGTTIDDFAKFIVFRKTNKELAEEILNDSDSPERLQELLIYNMDMLK